MSTNSSTSSDSLHAQLAAVIEVLANTAVAEICKLVDDGYAELRLEITQNQRERDSLRRKLLVAKFQTSRRNHNHHLDNATRQDMDIFIDGLIWNVDNSSVVTLVISCLNLLTTLLMILGSCCQLRSVCV